MGIGCFMIIRSRKSVFRLTVAFSFALSFSLVSALAIPVHGRQDAPAKPLEQEQAESPPKPESPPADDDKEFANRFSKIDPATGLIPTAEAIAMMERRIDKNPQDFFSMTILGQLLMRDAKERDDHTSYDKAEEAFRKAIQTNEEAASSAQVYLIGALQSQHKFKQALEQSEIALKALPGNLVAISSKGDAELELGDVAAAEKSYQIVAEQAQTPGVLARLARLKELQGKPQEAIELIKEAREKSVAADERTETIAWYDFRLGMMLFGIGDLKGAEEAYNSGLARQPDDVKCLDGQAEVMVARGEYETAEKIYRRSLDLEEAPPTLAKFGDLLAMMNKSDEAKKNWDRAEELMKQEAATTGTAHYRERALFLMSHDRHLELALELAQKDLENRNDIYTQDTLAWALYKNGKYEQAYEKSSASQQSNVQDAGLQYRAGMIAAKTGHEDQAIEKLKLALKINPYFDVEQAKIARATLEDLKKSRSDVSAEK